jgi:hypothetical protein
LPLGRLPPGDFIEGPGFPEGPDLGGAVLGAPPNSTMLSGSTIKCVTSFESLGLAANSVSLVGRFRFCCWIATGWLTSSRSLFGSFPRRRSIPDTYGKPLTTSPVIIRHFLTPLIWSCHFDFSGSLPPGGLLESHNLSGACRGAVPFIAALLVVLRSLRRSALSGMSTS